jgi:hypothetical protein
MAQVRTMLLSAMAFSMTASVALMQRRPTAHLACG